MVKLDWYPFYFADYAADEAVQLMTYEAEGVYRRLLDHQWNEGGLPLDLEQLAALVPKIKARRFVGVIWPTMAAKFQMRDGRLVNPKLERIRREQMSAYATRTKRAIAGALGRWGRREADA